MFKYIEGARPITEVFKRMVEDREDNSTQTDDDTFGRATEKCYSCN